MYGKRYVTAQFKLDSYMCVSRVALEILCETCELHMSSVHMRAIAHVYRVYPLMPHHY